MFEFNVGDLVEARKGELVIRDRVVMKTYGLALGAMDWSLSGARLNGHILSLVEAATPPLPSEPGAYMTVDGDVLTLDKPLLGWACGSLSISAKSLELPLTKLEPVPDTAKKVLERLLKFWEFGPPRNILNEIDNIAKEFGASS